MSLDRFTDGRAEGSRNQEYLPLLAETLQKLPYHRSMGMKIEEYGDGHCLIRVAVSENILSPFGAVHGGILYSLCDVAAAIATFTRLAIDYLPVTADINVSILTAVSEGELDIKAKVLKMGKRSCFIDSRAMQGQELVAVARVTKTIIPFPRMKTILGL